MDKQVQEFVIISNVLFGVLLWVSLMKKILLRLLYYAETCNELTGQSTRNSATATQLLT